MLVFSLVNATDISSLAASDVAEVLVEVFLF